MATNTEVIRTLTIKSRTEGVQQTTAQMKELAGVSEEVARASVTQEKASLGVERAYNRLQRTFDTAFRAQQELAKVQNTLAQAQAQGLVTQERSNELMQAAIKHYNGASAAMNSTAAASSQMTKGMGESAIATERLTRGLSEAGRAAASANENLKAVAATAQSLTAGMSSAGKSTLESARATEQMTKSMSDAGRQAATLSRGLDANRASSDRMVKGMSAIGERTLDASKMIEKMSQAGRATVPALNAAGQATDRYGNAQKLARFELINLGRQIQDVGVSLASGQALFTVAIQQGSQIADVFATSGISAGGFARQIAGMITPMRLLVGGFTAVVGIGALLTDMLADTAIKFNNLSRLLDTPTDKLEGLARAAKIEGIDFDAFSKGMSTFADQISLAQKGLGDMQQLFRLNGETISKDMVTNLAKVADLVKNAATEVDKLNVLQAAGLPRTQEFARLMEQGGQAIRDAAERGGIGGLDQFAKEAENFKRAWRAAWTDFSTAALSAVAIALKGISSLATSAGEFLANATKLIPTQAAEQRAFTRADELALIELGKKRLEQMGMTQKASEDLADTEQKNAKTKKTFTLEELKAMDEALQKEKQRLQLLGDLATPQQKALIAQKEIQLARLRGVQISEQEERAILNNIELDTKHGAKLKELSQDYSEIERSVSSFANTLITGMLDGQSATVALGNSLNQLGRQLIQIGTQDFAKSISKSISDLLPSIGGLLGGAGGGLVTAGIGAGISLISRLFGSNEKAEEDAKRQQDALKQAQDAFAQMTTQIEDFNRAAAGLVKGELRTNLQELEAQRQPLAAAAIRAQNFAALARIQETFFEGQARLISEFVKSLPALHQALTAEGGIEGATAQTITAVKTFRVQILGLKDSLDQANEITGTSDFSQVWSQFAHEAQGAALAMLEQTEQQHELIIEFNRVQTTAGQLQDVLVELGMSAEDAAAAINQKLTEAIEKLRSRFLDDLIREVNRLAGGEWINQITDLVQQVAQLRADAAALGISTVLIDNFYALAAAEIIHENELIGNSLNTVALMTGFTAEHLKALADAMEEAAEVAKRSLDEINDAIQTNEDRLFLALHRGDSLADQLARFDLAAQREREAEMKAGGEAIVSLEAALAQERLNIIADFQKEAAEAALEAQKDALRAQISALEDQIRATERAIDVQQRLIEEQERALEAAIKIIDDARKRINSFVAGFLGGPSSFLSPLQQMNQAIATFNQQRSAAIGGDQDALSNITTVAQAAIDAIQRYYASSVPGVTLQQQILNQLTGLPALLRPEQFIVDAIDENAAAQLAKLQEQLAQQQAQLAVLNTQLAALNNVNTQVTGVNTDTNQLPGIKTDTGSTATNTAGTRNAAEDMAQSLLALAIIGSNTTNMANNIGILIAGLVPETNEHLFAIRRTLNQQNIFWGQPPGSVSLATFRQGGLIQGRSHDAGGKAILAEGGEYVMARDAVKALGLPFLNTMNANDNFSSAMISSIRQLERSMLRGIKALIEAEFEAAGIVVKPLQETTRNAKARRAERTAAG